MMRTNKSGGNMYEETWTTNPLGGECPHHCSYCYVRNVIKINKTLAQKYSGEQRLIESVLDGNTGEGKKIFVCSMNDLFAGEMTVGRISDIQKIMLACRKYPGNTYIFQTKNPRNLLKIIDDLKFPNTTHIGTTIETNREYLIAEHSEAPPVSDRAEAMSLIRKWIPVETFVTIEPIMDFDLDDFVSLIRDANPHYVNIGADSGNNNLPEPTGSDVIDLILELQSFTHVILKPNIRRLFQ